MWTLWYVGEQIVRIGRPPFEVAVLRTNLYATFIFKGSKEPYITVTFSYITHTQSHWMRQVRGHWPGPAEWPVGSLMIAKQGTSQGAFCDRGQTDKDTGASGKISQNANGEYKLFIRVSHDTDRIYPIFPAEKLWTFKISHMITDGFHKISSLWSCLKNISFRWRWSLMDASVEKPGVKVWGRPKSEGENYLNC